MDIRKVNVEKLQFSIYNPRKDLKPDDVEYQKLKKSIEEFGYVEPIIWNQATGNVVGGHQRLKVLIELNEKEIDCVVVNLDCVKEKALNLALNRIAGQWDIPLLTDLLTDLENSGFSLEVTGFDATEIDVLFNSMLTIDVREDDEFDLEKELEDVEIPFTKRGDIWQIGKNRIMCGDSSIKADVSKLMNGARAELALTDPPYNVNYGGREKKRDKIKNDNIDKDSFCALLKNCFSNMQEFLRIGAPFYIFHSSSEINNFNNALISANLSVRQTLIWVKNSIVMGRQDYHYKHEPILYGWKEGASHKWYADRKQSTVLNFDKTIRSDEHPTMKPLKLLAYLINNSSVAGDNIIDLFGGSGSTLIAAEQLHRNCYLMELEEKYCDVIIKRYKKFFDNADIKLIRNEKEIDFQL